MADCVESSEASEIELRNSDYDYSRFADIGTDLSLATCVSELSSALGSVSIYSLPPSEVAVEMNSVLSQYSVYSKYSAAPSEADVEMPEDAAALKFPLTTAQKASAGVEPTETSVYSIYSAPPSETAVEMNASLYPQAYKTAAVEVTNEFMALAPDALGFEPVAIDSLLVDYDAPLVPVTSFDDLQTAVQHASAVNTATGASGEFAWDSALETCTEGSVYSEYSAAPSEADVEMPDDFSALTFPLTAPFDTASDALQSMYAFAELNPDDSVHPLQFRRCSQYAFEEMRDFQVWHVDYQVDDSITVDSRSEQFVHLQPKGAKKMFAADASEYCVDKV